MNIYIVIPAHNEEDSIGLTLKSVVDQTLLPKQVVVVNDNSTDNTQSVIEGFASRYSWISLINIHSSSEHIPGKKVVDAFYKGLETLDNHYDIICKFDADIILPQGYLERITDIFKNNEQVGIAGGLSYILKNNYWIYEPISSKKHVRGPFKAYRKECFLEIGQLKRSIGWDTVDELLAKYNGWQIQTDETLKVKHLKHTGSSYNKSSWHLQGEALYKMRYGLLLTFLTALKLAYKKRNASLIRIYLVGYFKARSNKLDFLVTKDQGKFIRDLRWQGIKKRGSN